MSNLVVFLLDLKLKSKKCSFFNQVCFEQNGTNIAHFQQQQCEHIRKQHQTNLKNVTHQNFETNHRQKTSICVMTLIQKNSSQIYNIFRFKKTCRIDIHIQTNNLEKVQIWFK